MNVKEKHDALKPVEFENFCRWLAQKYREDMERQEKALQEEQE